MQRKENTKEIAQKLKKWFSSSEEGWIAICLLPAFMKDCDAEAISQNAIFWMRSLVQALSSKQSAALQAATLQCILQVLKLSIEYDDISREFSKNFLHQLLTGLISQNKTETVNKESRIAVFRQCVTSYPGPTGRFRSQIESQCLSELSSDNESLRTEICACLAVLPRCGTSGEKGMKYAEFWSKQCTLILNTVSQLMEELFHSESQENKKTATLRLSKVKPAEPKHSNVISKRIESLMTILKEMICASFPNKIQLSLHGLLSLCCKLFDVEADFGKASIESVCINTVLPKLHKAALSLINALTAQLGSMILPYEGKIFNMIYQALNSAQMLNQRSMQGYNSLRVEAYQLLYTWHATVGPTENELMLKVVDIMLQDAEPQFQNEKATLNEAGGKRKKLTQSQKLQQDIMQEELTGKKVNRSENSDLAFAALTALDSSINTTGPIMPVALISKIQNFVITACKMLSESSKQATKAFPAPYGSTKCRLQLFQCAFALLSLYHHTLPTPLSAFISLFQNGVSDPSFEVSSYCKTCQGLADKVIRPVVPAMREYSKDSVGNHEDAEREDLEKSTAMLSNELFSTFGAWSNQVSHETTYEDLNLGKSQKQTSKTNDQQMTQRESPLAMEFNKSDVSEANVNAQSVGDINKDLEQSHRPEGEREKSLSPSVVSRDITEGQEVSNVREQTGLSFEKIASKVIVASVSGQSEKRGAHGDSYFQAEHDEGEVSSKRQRLDIVEKERGNSAKEVTEMVDMEDKRNSLLTNEADLSMVKDDERKTQIDSEDEASTMLQSFVNSMPDDSD